ncbi:MAG: cytochrome c [Woeseiaceae bacterium]|nr:cytochrome c [Woeseiaceae bacterium]
MNVKRNCGASLRAGILAMSLMFAGTTAVQAQEDAEWSVEVRQSVLKLVRWNMAPMANMARGRAPLDIEVVETNSARIEGLFGMMDAAFANDTRGADVDTDALDRIWEERDAFAEKISAARQVAADLNAAAGTGDEDSVMAGIGALGRSCGSCHDDYKAD